MKGEPLSGREAAGASERLAGLFHFHDLAAFVVAALGADPMRQLGFVAVRTMRKRFALQEIVGAPASGTSFGVAPFWIRHGKILYFQQETPRWADFLAAEYSRISQSGSRPYGGVRPKRGLNPGYPSAVGETASSPPLQWRESREK
jgi:hypothetical protein